MRQYICCLLQLHNGTQVKEDSNILTKAPKKLKHQKTNKQSQTLKGRNSAYHGKAASFYQKKKRKMSKSFPYPFEPQCQIILLLMYPLPMVYKKSSLENRNAPEKRYSKRQENYIVDKHNHPMWHHNLSTLVSNES